MEVATKTFEARADRESGLKTLAPEVDSLAQGGMSNGKEMGRTRSEVYIFLFNSGEKPPFPKITSMFTFML